MQSNGISQPKPNHDTAPSTQSKGFAHPRLHNAATPPVSWGTFEGSHETETDVTTPACHQHSRRASPSRPNHGTVPSTQSKGTCATKTAQGRDTSCVGGTFERSYEAETAPRHLCATGVAAGHRLAETHQGALEHEHRQRREQNHRRPQAGRTTTTNNHPRSPRRCLHGGSDVHNVVIARSSKTRSWTFAQRQGFE